MEFPNFSKLVWLQAVKTCCSLLKGTWNNCYSYGFHSMEWEEFVKTELWSQQQRDKFMHMKVLNIVRIDKLSRPCHAMQANMEREIQYDFYVANTIIFDRSVLLQRQRIVNVKLCQTLAFSCNRFCYDYYLLERPLGYHKSKMKSCIATHIMLAIKSCVLLY